MGTLRQMQSRKQSIRGSAHQRCSGFVCQTKAQQPLFRPKNPLYGKQIVWPEFIFTRTFCGLTAGGQPVGLQLPVLAITALLQNAPRRPLTRLMTRTTKPTTRSKWISAPPICRLKPRSHKIRRTATIVQSMTTSCAHFEHPNVNLIQHPRENLYSANGTRQ
jgi:hypothetical protein